MPGASNEQRHIFAFVFFPHYILINLMETSHESPFFLHDAALIRTFLPPRAAFSHPSTIRVS